MMIDSAPGVNIKILILPRAGGLRETSRSMGRSTTKPRPRREMPDGRLVLDRQERTGEAS